MTDPFDGTDTASDRSRAAHPAGVSRRQALTLLGVAGVALVPGCRSGGSDQGQTAAGSTSTTSPGAATGPSTTAVPQTAACVLTPEFTEGPFYLDLDNVRSDITEGRPGSPLELQITVVDATGCAALKDAAVDIWHADAGGAYSGFGAGGAGQTFLRGTQMSDGAGLVTFRTIYPGWYQGRAVHIHTKVHVSGSEVHTGQLFFDDRVSDAVYASAPYTGRTGSHLRNAQDGIYRGGSSDSAVLHPTPQGAGHVAKIVVGVRSGAARNQA